MWDRVRPTFFPERFREIEVVPEISFSGDPACGKEKCKNVGLTPSASRERGIHHRWDAIGTGLSTLTRVTAALTNDRGGRIHIRKTTDPGPIHLNILRALGASFKILKTKKDRL